LGTSLRHTAVVIGFEVERNWYRLNAIVAFLIDVIGLGKALVGSLGFIPGDLVKAAIAALVAVTLKRAYPIIEARQPAAAD